MTQSFNGLMALVSNKMEQRGELVHPQKWQATDVSKEPAAQMVELLHQDIMATMDSEDPNDYHGTIIPNLPWADDHFLERVCGEPLNPGKEWENWPWGNKAQESLNEDEQFNHNYMERYWPKHAGKTHDGRVKNPMDLDESVLFNTHRGIRHDYGDLRDVVELLAREPDTRQAYLPIWFPEDTGTTHMGRKPCTLGYHFIMRQNQLDIVYYIRSCDYFRHFRDDIYMTIRLALWVLEECRKLNPAWNDVKPGEFHMKITSLHMFINDYIQRYGHMPEEG